MKHILICLLIAVALVVYGYFFMLLPSNEVLLRLQNPEWSVTTGTVRESFVQKVNNSRSARPTYRVEVRYEYRVDLQLYVSDVYAFQGGLNMRGSEAEIQERLRSEFRVGQSIPVYYAASQPSYSALNPTSRWWQLLLMIGGGVLLWVYGILDIRSRIRLLKR